MKMPGILGHWLAVEDRGSEHNVMATKTDTNMHYIHMRTQFKSPSLDIVH